MKTYFIIVLYCFIFWEMFLGKPQRLQADDDQLSPMIKQLVLNSDHIITGAIDNITSEVQGHKTFLQGKVKVEDIISSDLKVGDVITVAWESFELMTIHHEYYKGIQVVWLLQKKGDIYYANQPARVQSLDAFEGIYNEINSYSTRVICSDNYFWQEQRKPILLIFRNIESGFVKLPIIDVQEGNLLFHEKIIFSVYPITSFNREKTILGKSPLTPTAGKMKKSEVVRELKTDEEYRIWVDLNDFYPFKKNSYYSVSLSIKGFPGQTIAAFEVRNNVRIPDKFDFLKIATDRFSSEAKKHTVQVLMDSVDAKTPEAAYEKLIHLKYLNLSNKNIRDISPLGSFFQIEQLDLSHNQIQDVTPIRQFRSLIFLDLSFNQIDNIEAIGYLGSINLLDLTKNEIDNASPLKNLMNIVFLFIGNNEIESIDALENLKRLRVLDASNNDIIEIRSLNKLLALQELHLKGNQIVNLDPVSFARNLTFLDVRENPISYVEQLDPLIKKHPDDYGKMIELKLLHDAFKEKAEDTPKEKSELLPELGKDATIEMKQPTTEQKTETFRQQVERTVGLKIDIEKQKKGNVVEILEKEGLILMQFQNNNYPKKDDLMTIYRKDDYIGTVKIVDLVKDQAVGKIVPELINDRKLNFAIGDSVRLQE